MIFLALLFQFVAAVALAWLANWIGLIPWRKSRQAHWSERARLLWPARVTAITNMFVIPMIAGGLSKLAFDCHQYWALGGLIACAGTLLGTYWFDHEVIPELRFKLWWREAIAGWGFRYGTWFVLIATMFVMPSRGAWEIAGVASLFLILHFAIQFGLFLKYLRWIKHIRPADERLQRIVAAVSMQAGIAMPKLSQMAGHHAQAFAFVTTRELIFTDRLLELCSDEEIAAVCTHEVAHLGESKTVLAGRLLGGLYTVPFIFMSPLTTAVGALGLILPFVLMALLIQFTKWLSLRMEKRADQIATARQLDEGVYARALEKIYEFNCLPAVNTNDRQTHPHLYDRMIAAGITPSFPRPAKPKGATWIGRVYLLVFVVLVVSNIMQGGAHDDPEL